MIEIETKKEIIEKARQHFSSNEWIDIPIVHVTTWLLLCPLWFFGRFIYLRKNGVYYKLASVTQVLDTNMQKKNQQFFICRKYLNQPPYCDVISLGTRGSLWAKFHKDWTNPLGGVQEQKCRHKYIIII